MNVSLKWPVSCPVFSVTISVFKIDVKLDVSQRLVSLSAKSDGEREFRDWSRGSRDTAGAKVAPERRERTYLATRPSISQRDQAPHRARNGGWISSRSPPCLTHVLWPHLPSCRWEAGGLGLASHLGVSGRQPGAGSVAPTPGRTLSGTRNAPPRP